MFRSSKNQMFDTTVFDVKTVLVLGAGASYHLGFPLGATLCQNILDNTSDPDSRTFKELMAMGFSKEQISAFHHEFAKSAAATIDDFLSTREEFVDIGRASIAQELIKYEDTAKLHRRTDNWFIQLREAIVAAAKTGQYAPVIVTFNYERSFDKYVVDLLEGTFGKQRAAQLCDIVRIFHVHGKLGHLDSDNTSEFRRPYKQEATPQEILESSKGIRVISELKDDHGKDMALARSAIKDASRVLFLGFGYHSMNLHRLGVVDLFKGDTWPGKDKYIGTAMGMPKNRMKELAEQGQGRLVLDGTGASIQDFLQKHDW